MGVFIACVKLKYSSKTCSIIGFIAERKLYVLLFKVTSASAFTSLKNRGSGKYYLHACTGYLENNV